MPATFTRTQDIVSVWRPLNTRETTRAQGLIELVERAIRREWPEVPSWVAHGQLPVDDLRDVVVWSVIPILAPGTKIPPNTKSYQETSGSESRSVTLDGSASSLMLTFAPWMVRVFDLAGGTTEQDDGPVAEYGFPEPAGPDGLWLDDGWGRRASR